jgi:predicted HNH restriction endonuclease
MALCILGKNDIRVRFPASALSCPGCYNGEAARLKDYYKERQREFKEIVDDIKAKLGCLKCEENSLCCLDFHHAEGKKHKEISWLMKTKNKQALLEELIKCVCLCSNCHRKLHAGLVVLSKDELGTATAQMRSLVETIKQRE